MATAILMGRYVRSTFVEDQREFVEHLQIGKQIGKLLDMPKGPQAPKHILLGHKSERSGKQVPNLQFVEKHLNFAHEISVLNGSDQIYRKFAER